MLSSLDVTRILAESSRDIVDAAVTSIEYYRKERALQLYCKSRRSNCLTMSFHPQRSGFYILPAGKSRLDTTEKYRPFAKDIWGAMITSVRQLPNDRIVEVDLDLKGQKFILVLEIIGPNGNVWLLDSNHGILASLREKTFTEGEIYQPSPLPEKYSPEMITTDQLNDVLDSDHDANPARLLEKNLFGFDYELAGTALNRLSNGTEPVIDIVELQKIIREMIGAYHDPARTVYAYIIKGKPVYYPMKIADREPVTSYPSLSQAQRKVLEIVKDVTETESHRESTLKAVRQKIKKTRRLIEKLESDIAEAADYETYLQYSDLLKTNMNRLERGMESITVDNLYGSGEPIAIPLDPSLPPQDNIAVYSRKYRKGKEGLALLIRRRDNMIEELKYLETALDEFDRDFENASGQYPELVPRASNGGGVSGGETISLPYKTYQTSTGLTVFVGKSGENNDRTTFEYARPYELWFHAAQCPGSHVVLKFPHKNFEPSATEIEEAAAVAAWFSKARNSATVPVSYTQKKYVRKPRKAKSGLVTIEREKTVFVEPRELEKKGE